MNFCSDNATGASPEVIQSLIQANEGHAMPYGNDALTKRVEDRIRDVFETDAAVYLVATGTAANALSLAAMTQPWGAVFCHPKSHIHVDECGAPEFFTAGAKLISLDDVNGKITSDGLAMAEAHIMGDDVHHVQPSAISISQASEAGTVYPAHMVREIADWAHARDVSVHMDGARFANAVVSLGCTPAEITWKAGVDILSFGGSKNGCMAAEAVVIFNRDLAKNFAFRRKRGGQLFSKMRFISAQFDAYLTDGLWLKNATHANAMAQELVKGLSDIPGAEFQSSTDANEIFVKLPEAVISGLYEDGFQFYRWDEPTAGRVIRLVTAFNTDPAHVDAFLASARKST
jgi:threonine aldolase